MLFKAKVSAICLEHYFSLIFKTTPPQKKPLNSSAFQDTKCFRIVSPKIGTVPLCHKNLQLWGWLCYCQPLAGKRRKKCLGSFLCKFKHQARATFITCGVSIDLGRFFLMSLFRICGFYCFLRKCESK